MPLHRKLLTFSPFMLLKLDALVWFNRKLFHYLFFFFSYFKKFESLSSCRLKDNQNKRKIYLIDARRHINRTDFFLFFLSIIRMLCLQRKNNKERNKIQAPWKDFRFVSLFLFLSGIDALISRYLVFTASNTGYIDFNILMSKRPENILAILQRWNNFRIPWRDTRQKG